MLDPSIFVTNSKNDVGIATVGVPDTHVDVFWFRSGGGAKELRVESVEDLHLFNGSITDPEKELIREKPE